MSCAKIMVVFEFQILKESCTFAAPEGDGSFVQSPDFRDVAQPGSALAWGARGRKFESCRPDLIINPLALTC